MNRIKKEKIINHNIYAIIQDYKTYGFIHVKKWLYNNYKIKLTIQEEEILYKTIKNYFKIKKIIKKVLTK